jgi:hypothetical protein
VGGTLLNTQNAVDGVLEIDLPAWLLVPERNRLEVNAQMVMGDYCANLGNRQAWTVIRRDSYIHLPYVEQETAFNLDLFPFPFDQNVNLTDVSLVLPEILSGPERDRLLQLAVELGWQANGDRITLRAVNAQDIDDTLRQSNHFITFGRPTNNAFLRDLNEYLPQPFQPNTNQLAPGLDSAALIETVNRNAGLLQELTSPWNAQKTILVITGTTDEGTALAFDLLLGNLPEEMMATVDVVGNLAVIEGERVYSTDTRLLEADSLSQQLKPERVEPVALPGSPPQRELVGRWW